MTTDKKPSSEGLVPEEPVASRTLARTGEVFSLWLTYAQAGALIAIALAAIVGIAQSIWAMVDVGNIRLGDLLMLFLYVEILSMVKGAALGTREVPIHTPVALAIVAVARYIVVDIEHLGAVAMLCTSTSIVLLVLALWVIRKAERRSRDLSA